MKSIYLIPLLLLLLTGCAAINHNYVMVSTGTIIGLSVAQNPGTQLYEGRLGYARTEFALVPTNKGTNDTIVGNGAKDATDVLMELRFTGIFSLSSGIYQRLAVGTEAVQQGATTAMFLKDKNGVLPAGAPAIQNLLMQHK